jgi:hypothetical protein
MEGVSMKRVALLVALHVLTRASTRLVLGHDAGLRGAPGPLITRSSTYESVRPRPDC